MTILNRGDADRMCPPAAMAVGGVVWTVTGLVGLGATKGSAGFNTAEVGFIGAHLLVLPGLIALARSDAATQRWARNALGVAAAGRGLFLVAEIAAVMTANDELPLFPLAALSTALSMVVGGIGVVRTRRWASWRRWAPFAMGMYPFVAMFPLLVATGDRPNTAVALWGLAQSAVGVALAIESTNRVGGQPRGSGVRRRAKRLHSLGIDPQPITGYADTDL